MTWFIRHHSRAYMVTIYGPLRSFDHACRVARSMGARGGRKPHLTTSRDRAKDYR